jgi:uncharacterized OB-fold protein
MRHIKAVNDTIVIEKPYMPHNSDAYKHDYEILKSKKEMGGNCGRCGSSTVEEQETKCVLKRNKTVNKLAVCHHYQERNEAS